VQPSIVTTTIILIDPKMIFQEEDMLQSNQSNLVDTTQKTIEIGVDASTCQKELISTAAEF